MSKRIILPFLLCLLSFSFAKGPKGGGGEGKSSKGKGSEKKEKKHEEESKGYEKKKEDHPYGLEKKQHESLPPGLQKKADRGEELPPPFQNAPGLSNYGKTREELKGPPTKPRSNE